MRSPSMPSPKMPPPSSHQRAMSWGAGGALPAASNEMPVKGGSEPVKGRNGLSSTGSLPAAPSPDRHPSSRSQQQQREDSSRSDQAGEAGARSGLSRSQAPASAASSAAAIAGADAAPKEPTTVLRGPGRGSGSSHSSSPAERVSREPFAAAPRRTHVDPAAGPPLPAQPSSSGSTAAPPLSTVAAAPQQPELRAGEPNGSPSPPRPRPAAPSADAVEAAAAPPTAPSGDAADAPRPQSAAAGSSSSLAREGPARRADDPYARPAKALSSGLVALYKMVNARYCNQRRLATPGPKYNRGYDDSEGHYIVLPGEEIFNRYTVQEVLGKGSFGTVLRCYDEKRRETVALKITRRGSNFRSQAKLELDILLKLNENPNLNHLVVKLLKVFDWQGHLVLVFELLSFNLYQLIKCTRYNGVSLDLVRKFAYQLVCTLLQLELHQPHPVIHCDIKPENILLRNQNRSGIRLIDFGSACYSDRCLHKYIQSRFYRSPEVILGLGYTTAIDRWSLGCVLVELHTGMPLFSGSSEASQLARFEGTLGQLPYDMLATAPKRDKFYNEVQEGVFRLKEPAMPRRSLESVLGVTTGGPRGTRCGTQGHDEESYREFLSFITQLLRYRPASRISCHDALRHPFLSQLYYSDLMQRQARRQQATPSSNPAPAEASQ